MRYIFKHEANDPPRGNGFAPTNRIIKDQIVELLNDTKNQLTVSVRGAAHNTSSNVLGTQLRLDINDTGDDNGELLELKNKPTNIPNIDKINDAYFKICSWNIDSPDKVNNFTTNVIPQLNVLRQKFLQLYTYLKDTCGLATNTTFDKLSSGIIANTSVPENPTVSVMGVDGSIYRLSDHTGLQSFFRNVIPALISHIDDPPQIQIVDNEDLNGDTLNDVLYNCLLYSLNNAKVIVLTRFSS